ncbi:hypothetical protein [Streptomyces sp. NPDC046685]|uniref:hypothetical protein n=1 Tax=Streptomyces sp. NPDC046685 TaxID=3157202 RepID=UPI003408F3E5
MLSPDGGGSVITSVIAGSRRDFNRTAPALTPLPGGRFLLAWVENRFHTCATAAFGSGPEGVLLAWSDQDANGGVTVRGRTFDVVSNQLT